MQRLFKFFLKLVTAIIQLKSVKYSSADVATATDLPIQNNLGIAEDQQSISDAGLALLCEFEGKRLVAYDDGVGVWSIGFGTTVYPDGARVKPGDRCTEIQARTYMLQDLKKFETVVRQSVHIQLSQNQFDALVSLAYNIGPTAFRHSTLVKKLNAEDIKGAADQFDVWIYAGGKPMQGLIRRRIKEKHLFLH